MNTTATIQSLINQLTIEEKAALTIGATPWRTFSVERLGLQAITMSDGPHGVRRSKDITTLISESVPATCFPVAAATASTWDTGLMHELGQALAEECIAIGVDILLGPGINMKRSPLCGRNFEYLSEDPLLAGEMSASLIQGVQSMGIGTSLKHFAVNNQETQRFTINAVVDERTMYEIYLTGFEIAVKKGKPWTVMCAYNRINGDFGSEHEYLLTKVLRDQWHFEGFVVSDWGAVHNRVAALRAGLDLQMPGPAAYSVRAIVEAVKAGILDEAILDQTVERLLNIIFRAQETPKGKGAIDVNAHHALAQRIAADSIVLLKNDNKLLPLTGNEHIAVIGRAAKTPSYQGGGSSHVNTIRLDVPLEVLQSQAEVHYAIGDGTKAEVDQALITEAVKVAKAADVALLYIALPSSIESEGYDRPHLNLTAHQTALIQAVAVAQPRTVVILNNGSAIDMRAWIDKVPAVLEAWLPGQAGAGAVADVLFGRVNPSGKLAETFPLCLEDTPSYLNFPGENGEVRYGEGLFIGYRGYEARNQKVLFPFGYGLSYTEFGYSNLRVSRQSFTLDQTLEVGLDVTNKGDRAGKETVQLYVHDAASRLPRPYKELKAFVKVALNPGETKRVTMTLDSRAFSYYDPAYGRWLAEAGEFEILVGSSSAAIHLKQTVTLTAGTPLPSRLNADSLLGDWMDDPRGAEIVRPLVQMMSAAMGGETSGDTLGTDMSVFFRDLPLNMLFAFQGGTGDMSPEEIVAGMLKQVQEATGD